MGPLVGTIGALVTTMLLLSKATKIAYGTYMIFNKVMMFFTFCLMLKEWQRWVTLLQLAY